MRLLDLGELTELIIMIDRWVAGQGDAIREASLGTIWGVWHLAIERSTPGAELRSFAISLHRLDAAIRDRFEGIDFEAQSVPRGTDLSLVLDTDHAVRFPPAHPYPDGRRN